MGVSIQDLYDLWQSRNKGMLKIKINLLRMKKEGLIFFKEDVGMIEKDEPFDLYLALKSKKIHRQDAFPVPTHLMQNEKNPSHRYAYYKKYFQNYYEKELSEEDCKLYDGEKPFVGERYVWYKKKQA